MSKFIYIRNAEDAAYMNSVANFKGMSQDATSAKVVLFFDAAASTASGNNYDKITLSVTDGKEKEVMETIAGSLEGSKSGTVAVVADEFGANYVNANITAVDKIELNSSATLNQVRTVEAITNAAAVTRTLTRAESGTLFTVDISTADNDVTLTLPAVASNAGTFYDFCFLVDSDDDADFILKTEGDTVDIFGGLTTLAANSTVDAFAGMSKITVDGSVAQSVEGMNMHLLCDGVNWHMTGHLMTAIATVHLVGSATV